MVAERLPLPGREPFLQTRARTAPALLTAIEAGRGLREVAQVVVTTILALLVLLGIVAAWTHRQRLGGATKDLCQSLFDMQPVEAGLLLFAATVIANVFCLPSFGLWIGAGVVFAHIFDGKVLQGAAAGTAAVFSGVSVGGLMAFAIGRTLFRSCLARRLHRLEWVEVLDEIVEQEGWKFVLVARMSPFLPLEALNYACSLTSLSATGFALGSLGSLPITAFWVWTAASAESLRMSSETDSSVTPRKVYSRSDLAVMIGLTVIMLCVLTGLVWSSKRRYQEMLERRIPAVALRRVARSQDLVNVVICSSDFPHGARTKSQHHCRPQNWHHCRPQN
ncbi:unnamed protein product [Symbiodinium pilosum]|uniref:VTT domain-containing protein n=1 Tax=Symbiodinium pilosum TaxID=2952 RepID=A0A812JUN0_SYMPI|nr:unnamed protein product [Symbiodinium pilosum]